MGVIKSSTTCKRSLINFNGISSTPTASDIASEIDSATSVALSAVNEKLLYVLEVVPINAEGILSLTLLATSNYSVYI